jgi:hypothetical protein
MPTVDELGEQLQAIKDKSCAGRIKESLSSLNEDLTKVMSNENHDDYLDDPALSIETFKLTVVCFSYGGPSDYLEIKWFGNDHNWEIKSVTYRFSDWFDTATLEVEEGTPAYEYARNLIENGAI